MKKTKNNVLSNEFTIIMIGIITPTVWDWYKSDGAVPGSGNGLLYRAEEFWEF
jgi:hypothetical protein